MGQLSSMLPEFGRRLAHQDACRLSDNILQDRSLQTAVIDLTDVEETTTSAFARLVLLRRQLLEQGRDLRLLGLHDRAETLYRLSRLEMVLPLA